jgi:catechol 2,3-dioxygenase-like lactoylglutathione lyase family enzyme
MAVPLLHLGLLVHDQRRSLRFYETYFGFDEVTASYGRFGPFLVGLTCDPAELPERLGLG